MLAIDTAQKVGFSATRELLTSRRAVGESQLGELPLDLTRLQGSSCHGSESAGSQRDDIVAVRIACNDRVLDIVFSAQPVRKAFTS